MASETLGIEIPITVVDNSSASIANVQRKLTGIEAAVVKMNSRKGLASIGIVDKASAVLKTIESTIKNLVQKAWVFTVNLAGNALSALHSLFDTLTSPLA